MRGEESGLPGPLGRKQLLELFEELSTELGMRGARAHVYLFGGAAMSGSNRVAHAMALTGITRTTLALEIGLSQACISDVVRQRHRTITVANTRRFARHFGCSIEDLFPADA